MQKESAISQKIESSLNLQRVFFNQGKTKPYDFRLKMLKKLRAAIVSNESKILEALKLDLNKNEFESYFSEVGIVLSELDLTIKKLKQWMKGKNVSSPLFSFYSRSFIHSEPYGQVLIIAPWNYPFQLLISPLIGAIAAGNTVMLKPSEIASNSSALCAEMIAQHFDEAYISIFEGGIETSTALLDQKFDYIFFTGGTEVGRIVYQAAAKKLTPVTLELGGKSPCIVHHDTNIEITAKRIVWGKFINAGQTCIAPDYIFVHASIKLKFIEALKSHILAFYGENPELSKDFARIVSDKHFDRLTAAMQKEQIIFGGQSDRKNRFIAPTLIELSNTKAPIMEAEIFGPLLPILVYEQLDEVIQYINSNPKPLALYVFSKSQAIQNQIVQNTSTGGVTINDTLMHIGNVNLPFGGVGDSGIGAYHGKHSFDLFSHKKAVLKHYFFPDLKIRYAPYRFSRNLLVKLMKWFS